MDLHSYFYTFLFWFIVSFLPPLQLSFDQPGIKVWNQARAQAQDFEIVRFCLQPMIQIAVGWTTAALKEHFGAAFNFFVRG